MALVPKNWSEFQHYKDRSPIWIKLHRTLLDNYEFHRLPIASKALAPLLWLLASEYERGEITASFEAIAFRLRMSDAEFVEALKPLIDAEFFTSASKPIARRKRDAIPEKEKETQEKIETEKDIRAVADATRPSDDLFEEFWKVYPRREGSNPKAPARDKFRVHVKNGADPRAIIAAAGRYALEIRENKTEPRFVAQAKTWLSQQRFDDYRPPPDTRVEPPTGAPTDEQLRAKYGQQHRTVPAETDGQANGTGADHAENLRSAGARVCSSIGAGDIPDHQSGDAGIYGLGAVLPKSSGRGSVCVSDGARGENQGDDGPDSMARMV